jgi:hypothetical protein
MRYVREGLDQADRGEVAPWNSDDIKAAGRRRTICSMPRIVLTQEGIEVAATV